MRRVSEFRDGEKMNLGNFSLSKISSFAVSPASL